MSEKQQKVGTLVGFRTGVSVIVKMKEDDGNLYEVPMTKVKLMDGKPYPVGKYLNGDVVIDEGYVPKRCQSAEERNFGGW